MPCKQSLIEEYDRFYLHNPRIWIDDTRNQFAFSALSGYLKQAPASVLDVGCGNGHTIKYFSERWQDTRFTGLDLSPVAIKIAKKLNGMNIFSEFCYLLEAA